MKTAELTGALLDYWVARANGWTFGPPHKKHDWDVWRDSSGEITGTIPAQAYQPSHDWAQAGPIIEREKIHLSPPDARVHRNGGSNAGWGESGVWMATTWHKGASGRRACGWDETSPLVAAMRCYVISKFGDEVPDDDRAATTASHNTKPAALSRCAAGRDGECGHAQCPQLRDDEPHTTGRHCPLESEGGRHD